MLLLEIKRVSKGDNVRCFRREKNASEDEIAGNMESDIIGKGKVSGCFLNRCMLCQGQFWINNHR